MRFARRILFLLGDRRRLLALAVLAALTHVLLSLAPPLVVRQLIVQLAAPGASLTTSVGWIVAVLAAVALTRAICFYLDSLLHHIAAYGMLAALRVTLYDHVQRLSHAFFSRRQTGALVNTVVNDVDTIEFFVAHSITQVIIGVCVPVGVAVVLVALNWRLAVLALLLAPLVVALMILTAPRLRAHWRAARRDLSEINALVQDSLAGLSVIKTFGAEEHRRRLVAERSAAFERSVVRALAFGGWPTAVIDLAAGLTTALVLSVGALWVSQGRLTLADLFVFLIYMVMLYRPLIELAHANEGLQAAMAAAERVFALLDERPTVIDRPDARAPARLEWSVSFERVTFGYEPTRPVLHEVSFRIEPGQLVALVGVSGAGKSTCAALVQRWYDPDVGVVRLGGHDLRDLPLDWLRGQISAVMQDVFLFHGSVRDNVLVGRPDASQTELEAAARAANAHDFIQALPEGYDTIIGERGVRLSGGQKQRLSIARALLKDAPVLVLDEATSSVDVETEALIQDALDRLVRQRTTLVIAHRLSTIRHADRIVVLEAGRVVEMGTHTELLAREGAYAALYRRQLDAGAWEIGTGEAAFAPRQGFTRREATTS